MVFFFIAFSDLVMLLSRKFNDSFRKREIHTKVKSWWIIYGIVFFVINLPVFYFSLALILLSFFGLSEMKRLLETKTKEKLAFYLLVLALVVYQLTLYKYRIEVVNFFAISILMILLPFVLVVKGKTPDFLSLVGRYFTSFYLIVLKIGYLGAFLSPPFFGENEVLGRNFLVYLILLTCLNDVFQFIFGNIFRGKKIVPLVSPDKTWSGFLGGLLGTVLLGFVAGPFLTPMTSLQSLFSSLLIGVFGFGGDVVFSAIKREHGVKDYGSIIPGHGGVLDRLNSMTYTAPVFYYFIIFSKLISLK